MRLPGLLRLLTAATAAVLLMACVAGEEAGGGTPITNVVPSITAQPSNQAVTAGQTATFSVGATGTPAPTYQWKRNGGDISGATSSSYTTPATTVADSGAQFQAVASNAAGSATSSTATLTVTAPGGTTTQILLNPGFESGTANWTQSNTSLIGNAPATNAHSGSYYAWLGGYQTASTDYLYQTVTIPSDATAASLTFWLWVMNLSTLPPPPSATNILTLKLRTSSGTDIKTLGTWSNVDNGTGHLQKGPFDLTAQKGQTVQIYWTSVQPSATGATNFLIDDTALNVLTGGSQAGPSITAQPANASVTVGQTASFSVGVSGTPAPSLQWQRSNDGGGSWANVAAGSGGTATTYTTAVTVAGDNGARFRATATNSVSTATSAAATLTVGGSAGAFAILSHPRNLSVVAGQPATFQVQVTGTSLAYQWYRSAAPISGATAATYTLPSAASADSGVGFYCAVRAAEGQGITQTAILTVISSTQPAVILVQPKSVAVVAGQTATFQVSATGGGTLNYQWSKGGSPLSGATSASYSTAPVTSGDDYTTYTVTINNGNGLTTSNSAALRVISATTSPLISDFSAFPANITPGGSTTLSWSAAGATSFSIDNGVGIVSGTSLVLKPTTTTAYRLTATSALGSQVAQVTVAVDDELPLPTIHSFTASPALAIPGDTVILSWQVANAKQLSIDGGIGLVTGSSATVLYAGAATYTLTATGLGGSTTGRVTVPAATLLTKSTIATTGGTLSSAGFSLELPSGALSASSELELLSAAAPLDLQSQAITQAFVVRGLTDPLGKTIRVTLPVLGSATGAAILVVRDDAGWASSTGTPTANDRLIPVTIASGKIVADIPVSDPSLPAAPFSFSPAEAFAAGTERTRLSFWGITGHYAMTSSNGNFAIAYPVSVINMINTHLDLAEDLEKAYTLLTSRGFTRGSNRDWPLSVSIEQTSNEAETSYTFPGYYLQQVFGFDAMGGKRETLATTAAHELFHVFQSYYDPRTRFFKRRGPSDQYWWDEATAVWFQEMMVAEPTKYLPEDFAANPHESLIGLREGMQTATHGYGSGPLAKWLNRVNSTAALDIYKDLLKGTPVIRAIDYWAGQHYSGVSWYDRYVADLIDGSIYKGFDARLLFGGGSPVLVDRANLSVKIDWYNNPKWYARNVTMPPFSARFFVFYPGGAMEESWWDYLSMNAWSTNGGSPSSQVYIYDRATKKLGPGSIWTDGSQYNDLVTKRNWLVLVVVNAEDASRNINVEVSTASGCFPAGTPVQMADGSRRSIELMERGDRILVWDEATNTLVPGAVQARLTHAEQDAETLCLQAGGRDLHVTDNHPLRTADGRWVPAGELQPGDRLLLRDSASGNLVEERIASIVRDTSAHQVVYNLKTTHGNYLAADVLVHNKCLAAETLVDTVTGPRPIENLRVGDEVIGSSNGQRVVTRVTHLYLKRTALPNLPGRELASGLRVTDNHPVWTAQGYVLAGSLNLPTTSISGPVYDLRTETGNVFSGQTLLGAKD